MLPFYDKSSTKFLADTLKLSVQAYDVYNYKFRCPRDRFPSFFFYSTTRNFTINIVDELNEITTPINYTNFPHKAYKLVDNTYVIVCNSDSLGCFEFECETQYHFEIGNMRSETFFPLRPPIDGERFDYTQIDISNPYDVGEIPFQAGFIATFWVFMPLRSFNLKTYQESKLENGKKVASKTIVGDLYSTTLIQIPQFLLNNLILSDICKKTVITYKDKVLQLDNGDFTIGTPEIDEYYGFNLPFSFEFNRRETDCRPKAITYMPLEILPINCPEYEEIEMDVECSDLDNQLVVAAIIKYESVITKTVILPD